MISIIIITFEIIFSSGKKRRRVESESSFERWGNFMIQCITPIGMLTGLEAYTTYFKLYPDQNSIPNRNVEGFYSDWYAIYWQKSSRYYKTFRTAEFSSGTKNAILNLMGAVYDLWDESDPIRKDWINGMKSIDLMWMM